MLTDRLETIKILEDNFILNTECSKSTTKNPETCQSQNPAADPSSPDTGSIAVETLDWSDRDNELYNKKWDYVIGADIIYIESSFADLLSTMRQLRTDHLILSCRLRYAKDHKFIKRAKEYFDVEKLLYDGRRDIYIYKFTSAMK